MVARRTWRIVVSVIGACIVGYFLYHTVEGERGWVTKVHLQNETVTAEETLEKLREEREALERRVRLIRPESTDPDLLDEQARKALNYTKPNEIVIITPPEKGGTK
ncbi:MAG: septum formation initiator family protein [Bdellovibrionales bacterium]